MMDTVICVHCGMARDRGSVPGRCNVCAPLPEQAREAQQRAEEASLRIDAAIRKARDGDDEDALPLRREPAPRPRIRDAVWLVGPNPRFLPHLFQPLAPTSCCGKVAHSHRLRIAPPGRRGCRRCAYAAGFTADAAEGVTT